jgi:hypothetical protein
LGQSRRTKRRERDARASALCVVALACLFVLPWLPCPAAPRRAVFPCFAAACWGRGRSSADDNNTRRSRQASRREDGEQCAAILLSGANRMATRSPLHSQGLTCQPADSKSTNMPCSRHAARVLPFAFADRRSNDAQHWAVCHSQPPGQLAQPMRGTNGTTAQPRDISSIVQFTLD